MAVLSVEVGLFSTGEDVALAQGLLVALGYHIGTYETDKGRFGPMTADAVKQWQRERKLSTTGRLDAESLKQLQADAIELPRAVRGVVSLVDGTPVPGLRVVALDIDFRTEERLGEAVTDKLGRYEIIYRLSSIAKAERLSADITIGVFKPRGRTLLNPPAPGQRRTIYMNAPIELTANIIFPREESGVLTEFEQLETDLRPLIGDVPFADIARDRDAEEGLFLARELEVSSDRIVHFTVAHRMAEKSKISPAFFFGVLRMHGLFGLDPARSHALTRPVDFATDTEAALHEMALLTSDGIGTAIDQAIKRNVIPNAVRKELGDVLQMLERRRPKADGFARQEIPKHILGTLEGLINTGKTSELLALLEAHDPHDVPALQAALFATPVVSKGKQEEAAARINLSALLGFNTALVNDVSTGMNVKKPADVRKLAKLQRTDWSEVLKDSKNLRVAGAPISSKSARDAASTIVRSFEKAFPTTAFTAQLARRKSPAIDSLGDIVDLLEAHPEFELQKHNLLPYLKEVGVDIGKIPDAVLTSIEQLQRIFVLSGSYSATEALIKAGYGASADIVATGEKQFVADAMKVAGLKKADAKRIFNSAQTTNLAAVTMATNLRMARGLGASVISAPQNDPASGGVVTPIQKIIARQPNLKDLFYGGDYCACDHSHSIYGPAAYLADLLGFLKKRKIKSPPAGGTVFVSPKDALFYRRPDVGEIDLNGPNATTQVPHIDIVCQLLEEAISSSPTYIFVGPIYSGTIPNRYVSQNLIQAVVDEGYKISTQAEIYGPFTYKVNGSPLYNNYVLRDQGITVALKPNGSDYEWRVLRQTHGTAEERAAAPEYVNTGAYDVLANGKAAFSLPFDLAHVETRALLTATGIDRADLMRTYQVAGTPSNEAIDGEIVGLSPGERAIIFNADPSAFAEVWGITIVSEMAKLDLFCQKTSLAFEDAERLISLPFIRGTNNLFIKHLDNSCNLSQKRIENFDADVLDRIHRLLRLSRKTGLPIAEIDRVAMAPKLGGGLLDIGTLSHFAELTRLSREMQIELHDLVTWLDVVPFRGENSEHAKLFENYALTGPVAAELSSVIMQNAGSTVALGTLEIIAGIAAAKAAKQADVEAIVNSPMLSATTNLDFGTLGEICGRLDLAKALKISVADLLALEVLFPQPALASPLALRTVYETVATIKRQNIPAANLVEQISPTALSIAARNASDAASVSDYLTRLRDSLVNATDKYASPFSTTASVAENLTAFETQLLALPNLNQGSIDALLDVVRKPILLSADVVAAKNALDSDEALNLSDTDTTIIKSIVESVYENTDPSATSNFLNEVMTRVAAGTQAWAQAEVLVDETSNWLKIDRKLTSALLGVSVEVGIELDGVGISIPLLATQSVAPSGIVTAAALDQFRAARLLSAVQKFIEHLKPTEQSIVVVLDHASALGWLSLNDIPFEIPPSSSLLGAWRNLAEVFYLTETTPDRPTLADPLLSHSVWKSFHELAVTASKADFLASFAALKGMSQDIVTDVDTVLSNTIGEYFVAPGWNRLQHAARIASTLSIPATAIAAYAGEHLSETERVSATAVLRQLYSQSDWLTVLKAVMDPIREMKRDALCAHLLVTNPHLTSIADLYDYFLIDPEWSAKMPSSLIVAAISAVQTFVLRCMSGLEPEATADTDNDPDWQQWDWMSKYRVWEVNRKVFIEPQYYLRPEWRDDKTELFESFEKLLLQNEVTPENVDTAFESYLNDLDQIAFMDVLTTCYDFTLDNLHVFACTKGGQPQLYYHCVLQRDRIWTPWRQITLDITGQHLAAFFRNGRLCLAWLTFLEKGNDNQDVAYPQPGSSMERPERYLEISLLVSEYSGKRWLPRRQAAQPLLTVPDKKIVDRAAILMIVNPNEDNFFIDIYHSRSDLSGGFTGHFRLGYFMLFGCKGYPETTQIAQQREPINSVGSEDYGDLALFSPVFKDAKTEAQRFAETNLDTDNDLALSSILAGGILFKKTPGIFRVTYPLYTSEIDQFLSALFPRLSDTLVLRFLGTLMPYFYEDNQRGYMLVPGFYEIQKDTSPDFAGITFSRLRRLLIDTLALIKRYVQSIELANQISSIPGRQAEIDRINSEFAKSDEVIRLQAEWQLLGHLRLGTRAQNFYHPMLCSLRSKFFSGGVKKMLSREAQLEIGPFVFEDQNYGYAPTQSIVPSFPKQELEFGRHRVYGSYNWELTYHIPFMIADKLMAEERFVEAETWLRMIFDPLSTSNAPGADSDPGPSRYWNTKPFYLHGEQNYRDQMIDNVMHRVAVDVNGTLDQELADTIVDWRRNPIRPFIVARGRTVAFQQATVFKMIKLFIEHGDYYFSRDQLEDLVTASLYYSRAERLLGRRPQIVPHSVEVPPETFNQLETSLDQFGNALRSLENLVPNLATLPEGGDELPTPAITLESLYFCIPPSEKLYELWDLLEERQYNLRNSRTIDGVERSLSLFAPPLSVEAMIQASANGLSIGAVVAGLSASRPIYKFKVMLRHAIELADIASGFSREMEQALASRDGEGLNHLKLAQERRLQDEQTGMMKEEIAAAKASVDSARQGKRVHEENRSFYSARPYMNGLEIAATSVFGAALILQTATAIGNAASGGLNAIPNFTIGVAGVGGSPTTLVVTGGTSIAKMADKLLVDLLGSIAGSLDKVGSMLSQQASYQLRKEEWDHSTKMAELEIARADIEISVAVIRHNISKEQLRLHEIKKQQMAAEEAYVKSKFTNLELFDWLSGELKGLSRQMFNLALKAAKAAENCYNFELGRIDSFIQPSKWDDRRKGMLAASNLVTDLRRMESAHFANNKREMEMTTHVSLARLQPRTLLELKTIGKCTFNMPEALFDLEHLGQYFRRIKSLSVTIPSVVGPYTTMALKVTQLSNRIRIDKKLGTQYAEDLNGDDRFKYNVAVGQSIETSRGEDDSGLFSQNLDDERYLPFEGSGLIGQYRIELPTELRNFDYNTISDVIFHIRYTARDGGGSFKDGVNASLVAQLNELKASLKDVDNGLYVAINLRRDRPDVWHKFKTSGSASVRIELEDLPYFAAALPANLVNMRCFVLRTGTGNPELYLNNSSDSTLGAVPGLPSLFSSSELTGLSFGTPIVLSASAGSATAPEDKINDITILAKYQISS